MGHQRFNRRSNRPRLRRFELRMDRRVPGYDTHKLPTRKLLPLLVRFQCAVDFGLKICDQITFSPPSLADRAKILINEALQLWQRSALKPYERFSSQQRNA